MAGGMTANTAVAAPLLHRLLAAGVEVAVVDNRLRVRPVDRITPALLDELTARKPELLAVFSRLQGMRATVGQVPMPCAVLAAVGGPGHCFSCGDPLAHPESYGRCDSCAVASELFYAEVPAAAGHWEIAQRHDFEERAAIMEFDGGLTRVEAERLALKGRSTWPKKRS